MKSKQRAKTAEPDVKQDEQEAERPIWFLGRELKAKPESGTEKPDKPSAKKTRPAKTAEAEQDQPAEGPTERRPSQLEAYMRYTKMRDPREDDDQLAPIAGPRGPPAGRDGANNENGISWDDAPPRRRPTARRPAGGLRLRDAVIAGVASMAVGALAGAVVYDRTNNSELSQAAFDSIGHFLTGLNIQQNANAADNNSAPVHQGSQGTSASFKKPVSTARLDVSDAKGNVNTPIPLSISAEPALPDQDIALRLTGLPADAYLSAGTKLANNAWLLKPGEEMGVKLMVPSAETSSLLIAVEAIEPRTGDLAAPTEEITVALGSTTPANATQVEPTSAPATDVKRNFNLPSKAQQETAAAQPIPAPLESKGNSGAADSTTLMRNGDKLLGIGDFTAARAFFSRARDLGNREASLRLGQTYDPVVFRERNVQGLKPDPTKALKYYLEARVAGIEDADDAINGLETWLKQ